MSVASKLFRSWAPNVMTPYNRVWLTGKAWLIEVSEGTGFDHQPLWGVTVVSRATKRYDEERSRLFRSHDEAWQYARAMQEADEGEVRT